MNTCRERSMRETLGRGFAWLDTGSHDMLLDATDFVARVSETAGSFTSPASRRSHTKRIYHKRTAGRTGTPLLKTALRTVSAGDC